MGFLNRIRKAKLIFVAFNFTPSGGSCASANEYFNYWQTKGVLVEKLSRDSRYGFIKILMACLFGNKVIFNGLYCFSFYDLILLCLLRRDSVIYLHESEYAINVFKKQSSIRFSLFKYAVKRHKIACISTVQQSFLRTEFGEINTALVYNTIPFIQKIKPLEGIVNIVMVGYLMERKGVSFYSELADYAKNKDKNWAFYWIGGNEGNNKSLYFSKNVNWLGVQSNPHYYYEKMDLLFLSSIDEPMGLVCTEALMHHKKCVVFKNTGFAEFIKDIEGCSIYDQYSIESAFIAIEKSISDNLNVAKTDAMLKNYFSAEKFSERLDDFVFN